MARLNVPGAASDLTRLTYRVYDPDAYGAIRGTGRTTAERTTTTSAINSAAEDARLNDGVLMLKGEYEINGTVQVRCHVDGWAGTITVYDTTLNPALLVGARTAGERLNDRNILLPHVIQAGKIGAGWSGTDVGVEISNAYSCHITTQRISNFSTNLWLSAYGTGNVYNDITLGHLENGKRNLRLAPGDAAGWVNQNTFIGGRCYVASAEGTAIAGVRHILIDTGTNPVNNNLFLNTSIEANGPEYHVECFGSYNIFQNCRWEASLGAKVQFNGTDGHSNVILYGYDAHNLAITQVNGALYNRLTSRSGELVQASAGTRGVIVAENRSSAANPVYVVMAPDAGFAADPATDYAVAMGANQTKLKRSTDAQPRIVIDGQLGTLSLDNGTVAPRNTFTPVGGAGVRLNTGFAAGTVTSLPTASITYRGMFLRVEGAAGVADGLYICEKDAADTYVWRQI